MALYDGSMSVIEAEPRVKNASSAADPGVLALEDGIAWLRLDDPGKKVNTLSTRLFDWFEAQIARVERERPEGLVIYSGKPDGFVAGADLEELRSAYREWPLFNVMLDNAEMSLAKTDRRIAARYLALGGRPDLSARVLEEYDLTTERVLGVTGHDRLLGNRRVLSWAVELRNPYVDALSHIQLRALRALRAGVADDAERQRVERLLLLTVNGVAAGLQNTG
jgi:hypothetical protein